MTFIDSIRVANQREMIVQVSFLVCAMWAVLCFAAINQRNSEDDSLPCIVDDRATAETDGFGSSIFATMADALAVCKSARRSIIVRSATPSDAMDEHMAAVRADHYEENIEIKSLCETHPSACPPSS